VRKRDPLLDTKILDATLEVLGEVGADGFTLDRVATRAAAGKAAIYRRWPSKNALILEAITHVKDRTLGKGPLPDTGTLRGDLLAMFRPMSKQEAERVMKLMAGLTSLLTEDRVLAQAADSFFVDPFAEAHAVLFERAIARGEVPKGADVKAVSRLLPKLAAYRSIVERKPFTRAFYVQMIDLVVLPALGVTPA
jgi:AcrR family transcriptional regulator